MSVCLSLCVCVCLIDFVGGGGLVVVVVVRRWLIDNYVFEERDRDYLAGTHD